MSAQPEHEESNVTPLPEATTALEARRIPLLPAATETERIGRLAKAVADTEFVPKSLRGNPPAIVAAILTGREMGIFPMRALRQIHVVEGKPTPSPELMMALAIKAGHYACVTETTHERATIEVLRHDWPESVREQGPKSLTWTLDDAVRAGLCSLNDEGRPIARSRNGNPLPWEAYTRAMLRSRVVSEACRTWLPDVVEGYSYAPEELGADVDEHGHARDLVDMADGDYDPMEGVPDDIREQVDEAMGDGEPQVDEHGQEITDAEIVEDDEDDDAEGGSDAAEPSSPGVADDTAAQAPQEAEPTEAEKLVNDHTRDELNVIAADLDIADADDLPNKPAVAAAIVEARRRQADGQAADVQQASETLEAEGLDQEAAVEPEGEAEGEGDYPDGGTPDWAAEAEAAGLTDANVILHARRLAKTLDGVDLPASMADVQAITDRRFVDGLFDLLHPDEGEDA